MLSQPASFQYNRKLVEIRPPFPSRGSLNQPEFYMNKISIITPVYNGAKYIQACLQNFADQQCPQAEHLIMDGGSNDGTVEMIQEWATQHPNVRLISEKDKGQSDAMNKGIRMAEGNIISFLNVDDYYEPGVLNRVLDIFTDLPEPSFVCSNLNIWNGDGTKRHFNKPSRLLLPEIISNKFEWPYNPTAYFYHKSLHDTTGLYNIDNHYCMDYEFILEAAKHIRLRYVDEVWGNFCVVEESKTFNSHTTASEEANKAGERIRERAKSFLSESDTEKLKKLLEEKEPIVKKSGKTNNFLTRLKHLLGI